MTKRTLETDVCIIGCGPAGITLARELSRPGTRVLIVESGYLEPDPFAQELLSGNGAGPVIKGYQGYLGASRSARVLGSATRWGGYCTPLSAADFQRREWVAGSGWPLCADDLEVFGARAASTLGIPPFDPADTALPESSDPDPGPLVARSYHIPFKPFLLRERFLSLAECPEFRAELGMTAVEIAARSDQVQWVRAMGSDGTELHIEAGIFILAAGAVENARMLMLNAQNITVNEEPLGRYFQEHFHVLAGKARIPSAQKWRDYVWAAPKPLLGYRLLKTLALSDDVQRDEQLLNANFEISAKLLGMREINNSIMTNGPIDADIFVRAEQGPNPESRMTLSDDADKLGRRKVSLHWKTRAQDWDSIVRSVPVVAAEVQRRWGIETKAVIHPEWPWPWAPAAPDQGTWSTWGCHHMGTTRMADDEASGVVDRDCRVYGMSNLFVAGSSVFPTGGFANPTFTIVALSIRLADHVRSVLHEDAHEKSHGSSQPARR
jgi:choline dehydrogenase-like flavoprotein